MTEFPGNRVQKEKMTVRYIWSLERQSLAHSVEETGIFSVSNSKITNFGMVQISYVESSE